MTRLMDAYWESMMDEPVELPAFLEQVAAGRWGGFTAAEIAEFLQQIERDIAASIQTKAGTNPALGAFADDRMDEAHRMIAELMRRYAGA